MAFLQSAPPREPFLHVPAVVIALIGALLGVYLALTLIPNAEETLTPLVFVPARYLYGGDLAGKLLSPVGHIFVHSSFTALALNSLWLLAFGPVVARRLGPGLFVLFFLLSGVAGAGALLAFDWGGGVGTIGASGAVGGVMAAGLRLMRWPGMPEAARLASLFQRPILLMSGVWLALNLAFAVMGTFSGGSPSWQTSVGGYFFGLLAIGLFDHLIRRKV